MVLYQSGSCGVVQYLKKIDIYIQQLYYFQQTCSFICIQVSLENGQFSFCIIFIFGASQLLLNLSKVVRNILDSTPFSSAAFLFNPLHPAATLFFVVQ